MNLNCGSHSAARNSAFRHGVPLPVGRAPRARRSGWAPLSRLPNISIGSSGKKLSCSGMSSEMRFTPGMLRNFSTSNELTPSGRMDTIASGHSSDGTNARMSDAPHTSTATNAAKPHPKAIAMPRRRRCGRASCASSGRTVSAGRSAKSTATKATASAITPATPITPHAKTGPTGNDVGSFDTKRASAPMPPRHPSSQPTPVANSDSAVTSNTTPPRVRPTVRSVASTRRFDSTASNKELTSRQSAVRIAAAKRSGRA